MKKILFVLSIFISFLSFGQSEDSSAYKFVLDYAVPSSPAFTALEITPQQVTKGSAAKPLIFNAFSNFLQTGRLDPGIAVDFSPYILLGGGFKNLDQYRANWCRRTLANSMLSLAAVKNSKDTGNTDIGLGVRINLFDSHDLFSNSKVAKSITNNIGNELAGKAKAKNGPGVPDDEIGTEGNVEGTVAVDLNRFYKEAYDSIKKIAGWAVSIGFGYRTTAESASLKSDSLINKQSQLWISSTRYTTGGFDIYGIVQGTFTDTSNSKWIGGLAIGSKNRKSNMGAELVYDFYKKEWNYGANFEIRILKQLTYVISLGKRSALINGVDVVNRFRVISNFRLNLFGH